MNNVSIVGNLVRDVELKYSASGVAFANLTVAVQRQFKNANGERESDFISCKAFKHTAEALANYTKKGDKIGIVGSIQTGSYEKSDGTRVYTTDVAVSSITFLEKKKDNDGQAAQTTQKGPMEVLEIDEEILPF